MILLLIPFHEPDVICQLSNLFMYYFCFHPIFSSFVDYDLKFKFLPFVWKWINLLRNFLPHIKIETKVIIPYCLALFYHSNTSCFLCRADSRTIRLDRLRVGLRGGPETIQAEFGPKNRIHFIFRSGSDLPLAQLRPELE